MANPKKELAESEALLRPSARALRNSQGSRMTADADTNGSDDMIPAPNGPRTNPAAHDGAVKSLVALIDEMILVIDAENAELAKGLPPLGPKRVDEKRKLADLFEKCMAEFTAVTEPMSVRDQVLREQLVGRFRKLRAVVNENVIRLRAAIEVKNDLIDAVMQAVREQVASAAPRGSGVRHAAVRSLSRSTRSGLH